MLKRVFVAVLNISMFACKSEIDRAYHIVPLRRRQKIDQLKNEKDKVRSLAAELLLNFCIIKSCFYENFLVVESDTKIENIIIKMVSMQDIEKSIVHNKAFLYEIEYQYNGKPMLTGVKDIYFNLSHAGDYVVCAISHMPVGIDVEGNHKINERIIKKYFSEAESNWINEDLKQKQERFFRLWTAKEAVSKATGRGLSQIIEGIYFKVGDKFQLENDELKANNLKDRYCLYEIDGLKKDGYCITVAVENRNCIIRN